MNVQVVTLPLRKNQIIFMNPALIVATMGLGKIINTNQENMKSVSFARVRGATPRGIIVGPVVERALKATQTGQRPANSR